VWQCIDLQLSDLLLARGDAVAGADEQDARPVHLDDGVRIIGQLLKHQRSLAWKFAAAAAATGTRLNRHLQLIDVRRLQLSPRGGETTCPPRMAVRLSADLRPSADSSAVSTSLLRR